jgi:hypothetical protein
MPYWRIAMEAFEFHLTQYRSYIEGLEKKDEQEQAKDWGDPVQLTFGKSNVGGKVTGDVFEGITPAEIGFVRRVEEVPEPPSGLSMELAGPWGFYETFRPAHGLQHLPKATVPEIAIAWGSTLEIPLFLRNNTALQQEVTLSLTEPEGWATQKGTGSYSLRAGDQLRVLITAVAPTSSERKLDEIVCNAKAGGQTIATIKLHVKLRSGGLPQN